MIITKKKNLLPKEYKGTTKKPKIKRVRVNIDYSKFGDLRNIVQTLSVSPLHTVGIDRTINSEPF